MLKKINVFINYLIIFFFSVIFVNMFFKETSVFYHVNAWIGLLGSFGIILFWTIIYYSIKKIKSISLKAEIIIISILFLVILMIQLFVILNFRANPSWDFGVVFDNAKNFALHGDRAYTQNYYEYFSLFPNNIMMFSFLVFIIKIGSIIGLSANLSCIIANIFFIDISILFMYLFVRKKTNIQTAIFSILIIMFFSPIYLYSSIFYTDTFSMPFVVILLYLFSFLPENDSLDKKNILLIVSIGIVSFIGIKLKMTVIFIIFSVLLNRLLNNNLKNTYKQISLIFCVFIICTLLFNILIVNNRKMDFKSNNEWGSIPITHWIMMGLEDSNRSNDGRNSIGGYNEEDYKLTKSKESRNEAIRFNIKEYIKRAKNYGLIGYFDYLAKKSVNTWTDGLYFSNIKLLFYSPANPDNVNRKYIDYRQDDFKYLEYTSQSVQISFILLLIASSFFTLKNKKVNNTYQVLITTILLLFFFFLFWENRSRYLVNYIPIFVLIITNFYYHIGGLICQKLKKK